MKNFPMFLKMTDRRVLIIGGGEQAAQKMRLMLKTEAEIYIIADELCGEIQYMIDKGRVLHRTKPVDVAFMQTAILVFSATDCPHKGAEHAKMAAQAHTIINVVDMPTLCEAMTPSIVDRDPLVIAIGTEGCAPILGRQIKSKIETMLEPALGRLVQFAGRMRGDVANSIPQKQHRMFWDWVFNNIPRITFNAGHERKSFGMIKSAIATGEFEKTNSGSVHFITSERQEPDLMTLRDLRALQSADMIFYETDDLLAILEYARRDALRMKHQFQNQSDVEDAAAIQTALRDGQNVVVISTTVLPKVSLTLVSDRASRR